MLDARDAGRSLLARFLGLAFGEAPMDRGDGTEGVDEGAGDRDDDESRARGAGGGGKPVDAATVVVTATAAEEGEGGCDVEVGWLEMEVDEGTRVGGCDGVEEGSELGS